MATNFYSKFLKFRFNRRTCRNFSAVVWLIKLYRAKNNMWFYSLRLDLSFILKSKTGRIMLCPTFVRPSVRPLTFCIRSIYSDTVQDIFMKLGTIINNYQTICREQEPTLHLHILRNYIPLNFFSWNSCPLYKFDTGGNVFIKLCTNKNHHQPTEKNCNSIYICYGIMLLWNFSMKIVSALQLWYRREYFHNTLFKYKSLSDDVQRKKRKSR